MKTLYLDCGMGAAGDMLTAALLELLPDPDAFLEELNAVGIPHVVFEKTTVYKCGIAACFRTAFPADRLCRTLREATTFH